MPPKRSWWEPDNAYRDMCTTDSILSDQPKHSMTTRSADSGTSSNRATNCNVMLVDKPTLQHLYSSLGFTIECAWLWREVQVGKASNKRKRGAEQQG